MEEKTLRSSPYFDHGSVRALQYTVNASMTEVLLEQRALYYLCDLIIIRSCFHHLLQIDFSVVEKADLQVAIRRQSYAIAAPTKVLAHRTYESNLAFIARNLVPLAS